MEANKNSVEKSMKCNVKDNDDDYFLYICEINVLKNWTKLTYTNGAACVLP